mmetsp:Transcript_11608/g.34413  ORF Transcript_11608/g.34413 Transcript_11608/m.34413 type:complete len:283 (+) Transcript_11608:558-1406(+)
MGAATGSGTALAKGSAATGRFCASTSSLLEACEKASTTGPCGVYPNLSRATAAMPVLLEGGAFPVATGISGRDAASMRRANGSAAWRRGALKMSSKSSPALALGAVLELDSGSSMGRRLRPAAPGGAPAVAPGRGAALSPLVSPGRGRAAALPAGATEAWIGSPNMLSPPAWRAVTLQPSLPARVGSGTGSGLDPRREGRRCSWPDSRGGAAAPAPAVVAQDPAATSATAAPGAAAALVARCPAAGAPPAAPAPSALVPASGESKRRRRPCRLPAAGAAAAG